MDWLIDLLTNRFLLVSLSSWFVAQAHRNQLTVGIQWRCFRESALTKLSPHAARPKTRGASVIKTESINLLYGVGTDSLGKWIYSAATWFA